MKKTKDSEDIRANEEVPETNAPAEETAQASQETENSADELAKWRETALRTAAEYDNYRKRSIKDREEFVRYANQALLEELLPVIDNFEMGMQMASQDTSSMIYIGMNMVQKQLHDFLDAQGVTPIDAQSGQEFDHNVHEAVQSEASDQPQGTILRVLRKGYKLKDRLLRPVNVVVAAAEEPTSEE